MIIYEERASGEMGWRFVNAGEKYRRLVNVSEEDQLIMVGLFKQATMGDCEVGEAEKNRFGIIENRQRDEWLKHKGMDYVEAMNKYIEKTEELAKIYETRSQAEEEEAQKQQQQATGNNKDKKTK